MAHCWDTSAMTSFSWLLSGSELSSSTAAPAARGGEHRQRGWRRRAGGAAGWLGGLALGASAQRRHAPIPALYHTHTHTPQLLTRELHGHLLVGGGLRVCRHALDADGSWGLHGTTHDQVQDRSVRGWVKGVRQARPASLLLGARLRATSLSESQEQVSHRAGDHGRRGLHHRAGGRWRFNHRAGRRRGLDHRAGGRWRFNHRAGRRRGLLHRAGWRR